MTPIQVVASDILRSLDACGLKITPSASEEIARSALRVLAQTYVPSPLVTEAIETTPLHGMQPDLVRNGYHGLLWAIVKDERR